MLFSVGPEWQLNDWISFYPSYEYYHKFEDSYESQHSLANSALAENTNQNSHNFRMELALSSVQPFLKGNFIMPLQTKISYHKVMSGVNVPATERVEIDFRMFF